jgi:hypothetical protein
MPLRGSSIFLVLTAACICSGSPALEAQGLKPCPPPHVEVYGAAPTTSDCTSTNSSHYLEIMAHGIAIPARFVSKTPEIGWSPGHAFMCIGTRLSSGVKEDCYGFFLRDVTAIGFIAGTGVVRNQLRDDAAIPERASRISVSVRRDITEGQRAQILQRIDVWNGQRYSITSHNCIDFVADAARVAGWSLPGREWNDNPLTWTEKLCRHNGACPSSSITPP